MMVPLLIDEEVRKEIKRLKFNAEYNPITLNSLKEMAAYETFLVDKENAFTCVIPMYFVVIYTNEEQEKGIVKHLSISLAIKDRLPNKHAIRTICEEFGYVNSLEDCIVKPLPCGKDIFAINIWEPVDGDWSLFKK